MNRLLLVIPVLVFTGLAFALGLGLRGDPSALPSALIGKDLPEFDLAGISGEGSGLASADLRGEVALINVWGSWCPPCLVEHPMLMEMAASDVVPLYGVNWRDEPENARRFLRRNGDPFTAIGADHDGRLAIELGVTAAPETFLIDRNGVIRHKHVGVITEEDWRAVLLPLIRELQAEGDSA